MFDEIAKRGEPGWSTEAHSNADDLNNRYQTEVQDRKQLAKEISEMISGGSPLAQNRARRAPSEARKALYEAIAVASTTSRLDELLPLAETLDAIFSTTTLVPMVKQVRGSNLAQRAPLARGLRTFFVDEQPKGELETLRTRALRLGFTDIALASFLAVPDSEIDEKRLVALVQLADKQPDAWWRVLAGLRRTYFLQYIKRDPSSAEASARATAPLCAQLPDLLQCGLITMLAGAANGDMGRLDTALKQFADARRIARQLATRDEEAIVLNVVAQVTSLRAQAAIDSVALSEAYFGEFALRSDTCNTRLYALDFLALAALERRRYDQAADFRARADALESGRCSDSPLRLNGETVRLRLLLAGIGTARALRDKLAILGQTETRDRLASYIDFLDAAALALDDRTSGDAALRRVIAAADADPKRPLAPLARKTAYSMLIENAAGAHDADSVTTLLAQQLGVRVPERCLVAIAQWQRVTVVVRGSQGEVAIETREVPVGTLTLSPSSVVPRPLRDHLTGCSRVEVMVSGPYLGMANILEPTTAWFFRSAGTAPAASPQAGGELVVTDVRPPEDINLPQLRSFHGAPSARVLRNADATPGATLEQMKTAGLIVIVAHGVTDAREPSAASLILSPDRDGEYMLTAAKVQSAHLDNAPVVVLAGCDAGRVQVTAEPWSLATSFLAAGARAVIAPTEQIPDDAAGDAFQSLVSRIRDGADPVDALQAERKARGAGAAWLSSIVVFE
ncbi:MAG TPA: CHAT domain-containing protein [Kofleriaceae bacterium]